MIYKALDREQLTVSSSVVQLTSSKITPSVTYAFIQVQENVIRVAVDGTNPAAGGAGLLFYPGDAFEVWGEDDLKNFKTIRETSNDAKIEVIYMGTS